MCLHGGSYDAEYFDCDADHSIATVAGALEIPVISVTRPGYCNSTIVPTENNDNETYAQRQGQYLKSTILPALWSNYGKQSGSTALVFLGHSIGGMMAIIAAGSHTGSEGFPLGGLIVSGIGSAPEPSARAAIMEILSSKPECVNFDPGLKDDLMLQLPHNNLTNPKMKDKTAHLNKPMPYDEAYDINVTWLDHLRQYAGAIRVPVMYNISEIDGLWLSTPDAIRNFRNAFISSPRVEAAILPMAPHCIELSRQSKGWLTRCCGFAMESAIQRNLRESS